MKFLGTHIPLPIASHLAQLQKLNRALYEFVPIEFLGHIQAAGLQNSILHIYADSPAWATKLRFYKPNIAAGLTTHMGSAIKSVRISVYPQNGDRKRHSFKKPSLSRNSAQLVASLARSIEDPELKRALSALAKHTSDK